MIGEISAITTAFLWSSTSIMIKSASDRMSVLSLNAVRSSAGALCVLITLVAVGKAGELGQTSLTAVAYLVGAVLIGMGLGDTLYFRSMSLVGVSRASPVSNIYPLFTLPIALIFLGEGLAWQNVVGMVIVVGGVYLVARSAKPQDGLAIAVERFRYEGLLLALAAAVCWALSTSIVKLALVDLNVFVANSIRIPVAAVILLGIAAKNGQGLNIKANGWRPFLVVAVAGVISIGAGGLLYLLAVQEAGAAKAATLSAIGPIFSVPLSMVFLKEKLTTSLVMGTVLSVFGIWLVI